MPCPKSLSKMIRLFSLLVFAAAALPAAALSVRVSPGTLRDAVPAPASVATLRIEGAVDASDFAFIASEMTSLATLDISAASISAYSGEPLHGLHSFEAATLPHFILAGTSISSIALPPSLAAIGDFAMAGTPVTEITLPETVRSIGAGAFAGCTQLRAASVAAPAAALGEGAFAQCTALQRVALPQGSAVPDRCFAGCASLAAVSGTDRATAVGERAFQGCTALKELTFGTELKTIGAHAFSGSGLRHADLGACSGLHTVEAAAFSGCGDLQSLSLPEGCDAGSAHALAMACTALSQASLPVAEIADFSLAGADGIGRLTLHPSLAHIGDNAMEGMTGLAEIDATALTSVPALGEGVWSGVSQKTVRLHTAPDMAEAFRCAAQWQEFDIRGQNSIDDIHAAPAGGIRARFDGHILLIECRETDAERIRVADTEGRTLALLAVGTDGRAVLDTSPWSTHTYLLAAEGARAQATLKIARKH